MPKTKELFVPQALSEVKCPVCGKEFIPAPQHVYKLIKGSKKQFVCTYKCMQAGRRSGKWK